MSDERTCVQDGDPCPKAGHQGAETRIVHVQGIGDFSQCVFCQLAFLDWYGGPSQKPTPADREAARARAIAAENPPQTSLALV